jgi:hypothetical protein
MRLIDVESLQRVEYWGSSIPPYAILSHTWDEGEVSFKDMASEITQSSKKGYTKTTHACKLARRRGIKYAWVDTCCI